jgi:O-antigen/teichoic acid export membrane protein
MSNNGQDYSLGERVLTGTLWMGAWRWTARLIGFVSTVILARLLLPEDFGIVATGMLAVAFFDVLIDLGADRYLIRLSDPQREDWDTAWTLRLLLIGTTSGIIFLAAAPLASYFGDSRLVNVLRVLAFASLLRGFTNIGLTMYRRDVEFRNVALVGLAQRLIGSTTMVILAFFLKSYWAMVLGEIAFAAAGVILSYRIHPYRPRLTLVRFAEQWDFSKWITVRNVASFLADRGDQLVVAKFFGIGQIGLYSMAIRFAALPTKHLTAPMLLPIYSGLARKQDEEIHFAHSVLQVVEATFAVVIPGVILFATLSEALVISILGEKWRGAVPLVAPLVATIAATVLAEPAVTTLTLRGRLKVLAALHWFAAIAVISVMLVAARFGNLEQLALARAALAVAFLVLTYGWTLAALPVPWRRLVGCIYRPGIAGFAMGIVITFIVDMTHGPWTTIGLAIVAGGVTYAGIVYALWRAASSPESGEALLVRKFSRLFARLFMRSAHAARK